MLQAEEQEQRGSKLGLAIVRLASEGNRGRSHHLIHNSEHLFLPFRRPRHSWQRDNPRILA